MVWNILGRETRPEWLEQCLGYGVIGVMGLEVTIGITFCYLVDHCEDPAFVEEPLKPLKVSRFQ